MLPMQYLVPFVQQRVEPPASTDGEECDGEPIDIRQPTQSSAVTGTLTLARTHASFFFLLPHLHS